jgi:predicted RNA-binding protein
MTGEGEQKLIMEDAVLIERKGDLLILRDILGEEKEVKGKIEEISFLDHKVMIGR